MKKVLFVFGTRPEAIKMAPVVTHFQEFANFKTLVCVTAQHREMLDQVLDIFDIKPDFDLDIMQKGQDLFQLTSRIIEQLKAVLESAQPDLVLVHGDTTTSTVAALASFYSKIPVAHVEAGLRTHDIYSPWPEEMNRQLTGRLSTFHFAPTQKSKENLLKENIAPEHIHVTGNTVIDALFEVTKKIESSAKTKTGITEALSNAGVDFDRPYILVTGHRRENFGDGFIDICKGLKTLAIKHPNFDIIYPVHLNPNVKKPVFDILGEVPNIKLIPPQDYLAFVYLLANCFFVITDSGGIQEEAPSLGKPVLVMRNTTERPEALEAGTVILVGTDSAQIVKSGEKLIADPIYYAKMAEAHNPYGDGKAKERILEFLNEHSWSA
jgi:UDP-N-acetylglucosamine 2-epimerase (non-hydrolysing)